MPLIALMTQGDPTEAQLNTLLRYMLQAGTTEHPGALIRTLAAQSPRHKELMMTIAEWLEEKGRKQGQQEGEQEATRSIAARMLARGLERQTVQELTGLSDEDSPRWRLIQQGRLCAAPLRSGRGGGRQIVAFPPRFTSVTSSPFSLRR